MGIIKDVEAVRHLAELGVVFLLFNIGLELSLERLRQMQKYVFGLGSAQVMIRRQSLPSHCDRNLLRSPLQLKCSSLFAGWQTPCVCDTLHAKASLPKAHGLLTTVKVVCLSLLILSI